MTFVEQPFCTPQHEPFPLLTKRSGLESCLKTERKTSFEKSQLSVIDGSEPNLSGGT